MRYSHFVFVFVAYVMVINSVSAESVDDWDADSPTAAVVDELKGTTEKIRAHLSAKRRADALLLEALDDSSSASEVQQADDGTEAPTHTKANRFFKTTWEPLKKKATLFEEAQSASSEAFDEITKAPLAPLQSTPARDDGSFLKTDADRKLFSIFLKQMEEDENVMMKQQGRLSEMKCPAAGGECSLKFAPLPPVAGSV